MASPTPAKAVYFSPLAEFPEGELPSRSNVIAYAKYILSKSEKKNKLQDSEIVSRVTEGDGDMDFLQSMLLLPDLFLQKAQ